MFNIHSNRPRLLPSRILLPNCMTPFEFQAMLKRRRDFELRSSWCRSHTKRHNRTPAPAGFSDHSANDWSPDLLDRLEREQSLSRSSNHDRVPDVPTLTIFVFAFSATPPPSLSLQMAQTTAVTNALLNLHGAQPAADPYLVHLFAPESNKDRCFLKYDDLGDGQTHVVKVDLWVGGYLKYLQMLHEKALACLLKHPWEGYLIGVIAHTGAMMREFMELVATNNHKCNEDAAELLYACMVRSAGGWGCNEHDGWAFVEALNGADPLSPGRIGKPTCSELVLCLT